MTTSIEPKPAGFNSLSELRTEHGRLIKRHRELESTSEVIKEIRNFVREGQLVGEKLDLFEERTAAQTLLDYWATILEGADHEFIDATLAEFAPERAPKLARSQFPYMGLHAFHERNHAMFFGRQELLKKLVSRVQENRLLAVIGASGSGKSSLVLGGLIPTLKQGGVTGSREWRYFGTGLSESESQHDAMVPGTMPLRHLARHLARMIKPADVELEGWIKTQVQLFSENTDHLARLVNESGAQPVVLVIDQFEETFTLCHDPEERQTFIDNLFELTKAVGPRHCVILTMRSDFESYVVTIPEFGKAFIDAEERVTPLGEKELRQVIEEPARRLKPPLQFEKGVVDALIKDVLGEPAGLPLLQFTLLKLWEERRGVRITREAYDRLGNARLALTRSADELLERLKQQEPDVEEIAKHILLRIARPGEGPEFTSNRIRREALWEDIKDSKEQEQIKWVTTQLVNAGLLRLTSRSASDEIQVEVAHEVLVRNWARLSKWLDEERAALVMRRRLEEKAREWVRLGEGQSGLLDEVPLLEAERWLMTDEAEALRYDPAVYRLVKASRNKVDSDKQEKEEAEREKETAQKREIEHLQEIASAKVRSNKRLYGFVAALCITVFGLVLISIYASDQRAFAERRGNEATEREKKAKNAKKIADDKAKEYALLLVAAKDREKQANQKLIAAKYEAGRITRNAGRKLTQANRQVANAQKRVLNAQTKADDLVRLAKIRADQKIGKAEKDAETTIKDAELEVWRAQREVKIAQARVVVANRGLDTAKEQARITIEEANKQLAVANEESRVAKAISLASRSDWLRTRPIDLLPASAALAIESLRQAPTVSGQQALRDSLKLLAQPVALVPLDKPVVAAAYRPNGEVLLVTRSKDGVVEISLLNPNGRVKVLKGWKLIRKVVLSEQGTLAVLLYQDGNLEAWSIQGDQFEKKITYSPVISSAKAMEIAVSPDGESLAAATKDSTAVLWRSKDSNVAAPFDIGEPTIDIRGESLVTAMAVSNNRGDDEQYFALATKRQNTFRIWNTKRVEKIIRVVQNLERSLLDSGEVTSFSFRSDRPFLAVATKSGRTSRDGKEIKTQSVVRIWNMQTRGEYSRIPLSHDVDVLSVTYSPTGKRLATASEDGAVRLWTDFGEEEARMSHADVVQAVTFSKDGNTLLTGSGNGKVVIWRPQGYSQEARIIATAAPTNNILAGSDNKFEAALNKSTQLLQVWERDRTPKREIARIPYDLTKKGQIISPDRKYIVDFSSIGSLGVSAKTVMTIWRGPGPNKQKIESTIIEGSVKNAVFTPDGTHLATTNSDEQSLIQIWQVSNCREVGRVQHEGKLKGVTFSKDGKYVITTGDAVLAMVWLWKPQDLIAEACSRLTRNLTKEEWVQYMGDGQPRKTCPHLP